MIFTATPPDGLTISDSHGRLDLARLVSVLNDPNINRQIIDAYRPCNEPPFVPPEAKSQ